MFRNNAWKRKNNFKHFSQEFLRATKSFFIGDKSTSRAYLYLEKESREERGIVTLCDSVRKKDASNCIRGNLNYFF